MFTDKKYFVKNTESNGGFVAEQILTNTFKSDIHNAYCINNSRV